MTETEASVVAAWKEAAADLGIRFTAPVFVAAADSLQVEYLGLIHDFGRRAGTLIRVLDQPSARHPLPMNDDYYWSTLGSGYGRYDRRLFIETLNDWGFVGPDSERPSWYTGKSWE